MKSEIRIRYTDIIRTFSNILFDKFKLDVYDVVEDYPRACFMTKLEVTSSERFMTKHVDDYMTMTIYYFPADPDNSRAELSTMQEDLRDLLLIELESLIPVHNRLKLEILELKNAVVDNVLQVKVEMTMSHSFYDSSKYESMDDVSLQIYKEDELTHEDTM